MKLPVTYLVQGLTPSGSRKFEVDLGESLRLQSDARLAVYSQGEAPDQGRAQEGGDQRPAS